MCTQRELLRNAYTIQSSCCKCVQLAQPNLYPNCKFNIFPRSQNTNLTYKITKIHSNSQILNTNQMSVTVSLSKHYITNIILVFRAAGRKIWAWKQRNGRPSRWLAWFLFVLLFEIRSISPRRCPYPLRFLVFDSETAD